MKILAPAVLAAGLALVCSMAVAQTEILQVIPEKSLAAVVTKNADAAEASFRDMAAKAGIELPKESFIEQLLRQLKVRPKVKKGEEKRGDASLPEGAVKEGGKPVIEGSVPSSLPRESTIDLKAPMAVVVVMPAWDVGVYPLALVVKVGDYKNLLQELADVVGAAGPEVTKDVTDFVKGPKESLYAAQLGSFAVIAKAEYVIRTFKAEAEKSLAVSNVAAIKDAYLLNDVAVYLNLDDTVKTQAVAINDYKQQKMQEIKNRPATPGALLSPERQATLLGAAFDFGVKGAGQVDALCYGFTFRPEGARITAHYQPAPDTDFARWVAGMKPAGLEMLQIMDAPARAAAGWAVDPDVIRDLNAILGDFLVKSGLLEDKEGSKGFMEAYRKVTEAACGQGALLIAPSPSEDKGILRAIYVTSLKPGADVRADIKDCIEKSPGIADIVHAHIKVKSKLEQNVETYRDCAIDKVTVTFEHTPDAAVAAKAPAAEPAAVEPPNGKNGDKEVKPPDAARGTVPLVTLFGPELTAYMAVTQDKLVYTVGYPTADALKAHLDKLLDHTLGNLVRSPEYLGATAGLPPVRSDMMFFSIAEMTRPLWARLLAEKNPNTAKALEELAFEKASAIGLSIVPAQNGILVEVNVPLQEMRNLKLLHDTGSPKKPAVEAPPPPADANTPK